MYMYNLFADLSEKTKDSVTPFVIVNLSNDQYLEFPENHVVAFAEKDDTEGEVFEIEQVDTTPRNWIPAQLPRSVTEIAKIDMETDLHSILTSTSNFIKSLVEVKTHRKVDLEDKKIKHARSHKSCAAVDYTPIGVEPHGPTQGVWPIATVANDSQLHLVASSI